MTNCLSKEQQKTIKSLDFVVSKELSENYVAILNLLVALYVKPKEKK